MRQLPQRKLQTPALSPQLSLLGRWISAPPPFLCLALEQDQVVGMVQSVLLTQRDMRHGEVCQKRTGQSAHLMGLKDTSESPSLLIQSYNLQASGMAEEDAEKAAAAARAVYGERFADKAKRVQRQSPHGRRPGWAVRPIIVKSGDDCRQVRINFSRLQQGPILQHCSTLLLFFLDVP